MVLRYASQPRDALPPVRAQRPQAPAAGAGDADTAGPAVRFQGLAGRVLRRLLRRSVPMVLAAALPLAGAFALIKFTAEQYRSAASVFVDPGNGRTGRTDGAADMAVMAMHARLATSRVIFESAMARDKLAEDSSVFVKPTGSAALLNVALSLLGKGPAGPAEDRKSAVLRLMNEQVSASPMGEANMIEIAATASHAGTAARLANAVADALVDNLVATRETADGSEQARHTARKQALQTRLNEVESKLAAYRMKHGIPAPDRAGQPGVTDVSTELARVRAASIDLRSRHDQIQKLLATGKDSEAIADLVRSPAIDRLRIQYNEAAAQEASLRTSLGPRHPSYLEAAEQARERKRLLWEGFRLAAATARSDMQAALDQERALEQRLGPEAARIVAAAAPPAQLRELEREVEAARSALDRHLRTVEGLDSAPQAEVARVVVRAAPAAAPLSGPQQAIWSAGMAASVVLVLIAFAVGGRRPSRRGSFSFGPIVGAMRGNRPVSVAPEATMAAPAPRPHTVVSPAAVIRPLGRQPVHEPTNGRPLSGEPMTRLAEEVSGRDRDFPLQVVLFTGTADPSERARLAIDFARTAARLDLRVLLLEADELDAGLTRRVAAQPVAATLTLNGRQRLVLAVTGAGQATVWAVPGEAERPAPANDGGLPHLPGIAGKFDLVVLSGPGLSANLACRKLARTAQTVVVAEAPGSAADAAAHARHLGIDPQHLRLISAQPAMAADVDVTDPPRRPMSVIRTVRCA